MDFNYFLYGYRRIPKNDNYKTNFIKDQQSDIFKAKKKFPEKMSIATSMSLLEDKIKIISRDRHNAFQIILF